MTFVSDEICVTGDVVRRFVETLTTGNLSLKSFLSSTGTQISYLQFLLLIIQEINKVKVVHILSEKLIII